MSLYSVILLCHSLSCAIFSVTYQRHHIMSFASVMFLCDSLLSSSFGVLNLPFTVFFLSLHSVISCVILLSCAIVIFIGHSLCQFRIYNRCVDLLLSSCSVMFFCRFLLSFPSVIFLCHCLLSRCSVVFFCHFLLSSSFGILKLSLTIVFCS